MKTGSLPRSLFHSQFVLIKVMLTNDTGVIKLLRSDPGLPPNNSVFIAEFRGLFAFSGPRGASTATYHTGFMVFDALTGNLLLYGAF